MSAGRNALGRRFVMGTAGSVNVMIAGVPAEIGQLDPAFHAERLAVFWVAGACASMPQLSGNRYRPLSNTDTRARGYTSRHIGPAAEAPLRRRRG